MNFVASHFCVVLLTVTLFTSEVFGGWPEDLKPLAEIASAINVKGQTFRSDEAFLYNFYQKNGNDLDRTKENLGNFAKLLDNKHKVFIGAKSTDSVNMFKQNIVRLLAGDVNRSPVLVLKIANWKTGDADKFVLATSFLTQEVAKLQGTIDKGAMLIVDVGGIGISNAPGLLTSIPTLKSSGVAMFPLPIVNAYVINAPTGKIAGYSVGDIVGGFAKNIANSTFVVDAQNPLPAEVGAILPPSHFKSGRAKEDTAFNTDIIQNLSTNDTIYNQYCFVQV